MDMLKKVLGMILGAGMGYLGTAIRVAIAGAAGYFVSQGFVTADAASGIVDQIVGVALSILAVVGSRLNSSAVASK